MKNALITGATRGMGRAIAITFAKEGFNLAICSRNEAELDTFKTELLGINANANIVTVKADVSKKEDIQAFAKAAEETLGFIDVVVNNAGIYQPTSILDDDDDVFQKLLNTNLLPAYELYRYFGKSLIRERKGHIFNICSSASIDVVTNAGMYSVTKFGLLGLNNVMRLELQQYGVKVTAVIPGSTLTSSWDGVAVDGAKFIMPNDIASAIVNAYRMSPGANVDQITIKPVFGQL
ncbi:SDR family oxidoreductase [Mucilaginibacter myungsuensis]|uniref:SDR family oxidoreductase n=1 Tax=Mucilaginibacter myungsuensis TaxID=649104 RepID=A0A929KT53_9SPHI|nr:SDR family oxidoreductase [Mucilaginibacter myungsuensis]MBE9660702.1 SDR family oxidoreductase [Mucilaginibacter myungsuensis]MDN3600747.1 SDR family oxidoreductase [Mucilaginibacter myungsuensis]